MTSRSLWATIAITAAPLLWVANCSSSDSSAPPTSSFECEDGGPSCGSGANGTISPPKKDSGGGTGGSGGSVETATVTLSVVQFLDTDFSDSTAAAFKGRATVSVPVASGLDPYSYGGDAGVDITAKNVLLGSAWYEVAPSESPDLLTTHAYLTLSNEQSKISVPVIGIDILSATYLQTPQASALDTTAGQIIVRFSDSSGNLLSGVRVTFSPFKGTTSFNLYDTGPGGGFAVDKNGTTETGSNGTLIITNVTDGIGALTYKYKNKEHQTPDILWVKPQATFARIVLPD